jgi:hypothetical protein
MAPLIIIVNQTQLVGNAQIVIRYLVGTDKTVEAFG